MRLNDQQSALVADLLARPGGPRTLDELVATAVAHDAGRPPDPRRRHDRPPGRSPTARPPDARSDDVVPAGTGLGVALHAGDVVRVEQVVDGQCADVNAFALGAEGQRLDAARTRAACGLRPTTGAVLWSTPPERPLLEFLADTAGPHDLGFPACSEAEFTRATGRPGHGSCVELQRETQRHWGLPPTAVHDPLNLWLPTDVLPDGRLCWWPVACRRGDHVDLRALSDVLVVVNPCASDLFGSSLYELGSVRVVVRGDRREPPAHPMGPLPRWRWRDLPVHDVAVELGDASADHVAAVARTGWLGDSAAEVARALVLRWWESVVLQLDGVAR